MRDIFDSMDHANSQLNDGRRHKYSKKLYYKLVVYMVLILLYVIYDAYAQKHFLEDDWHIIFMSKAIQVCQFSVGMLLPMSLLKLIFLRIKGIAYACNLTQNIRFFFILQNLIEL